MESIYLKSKGFKTRHYSAKTIITFKEYFRKYSESLSKLNSNRRPTIEDLFQHILGDIEIPETYFEDIRKAADPKNLKDPSYNYKRIIKETSMPASRRKKKAFKIKKSTQSLSGESDTKDEDGISGDGNPFTPMKSFPYTPREDNPSTSVKSIPPTSKKDIPPKSRKNIPSTSGKSTSSSREGTFISMEGIPSTSRESISLTSKQPDKAALRKENSLESLINKSREETINNQATIKTQNVLTKSARRRFRSKKTNDPLKVSKVDYPRSAEDTSFTTMYCDKTTTECKIKALEREKHVKNFGEEKNSNIQHQVDVTLLPSIPNEKTRPEIKKIPKKKNMPEIEVNEKDQDVTALSQALSDVNIVHKLHDKESPKDIIVSSNKHLNVNKTNLKKGRPDCAQKTIKKAFNKMAVIPQGEKTSETVDSVSEMCITNSKTFAEKKIDLKSKTVVEVDCQPKDDGNTDTNNASFDVEAPSTMPNNGDSANISTAPEDSDVFKVPCRRSTRNVNTKTAQYKNTVKLETLKSKKLQNVSDCFDPMTQEPTEVEEGKYDPRTISEIMAGSVKKGGTNNKRHHPVRGLINVDTTKRMGKKDLTSMVNFVVSFRIHKPFLRDCGRKGVRAGKCMQEIDVLNCQTLAQLREKITCESDFQDAAGEVSKWPYSPVMSLTKDKYKSGMFYIDNTFYVDTQEGAEDYSETIRKWAEEHKISVGETKPMNEAVIEDFKVRFGYPYVYIHQGGCEHLIIISSARLLTERDSLHSSDYPNLTKIARSQASYCSACSNLAEWVVYGSNQMIHDVNFMCQTCFQRLNYIGVEKVDNFKAYRYKPRAVLFY